MVLVVVGKRWRGLRGVKVSSEIFPASAQCIQ